MTVPHGRTRLVVVVASLLTAALPAIAWAQSPSIPASTPAASAAVASQAPTPAPTTAPASASATVAPSAGASAAPGSAAPSAGASPAGSPGASWTPAPASGPVALLTSGAADAGRTTALRTAFQTILGESCPTATLDPRSADTADAQAQQARDAVAAGARVLVLDPVDAAAAGAIVAEAQGSGAKVIALGDTITGGVPDYQVAYDPSATGPIVASVVISVAADAADAELATDATPIPSDAPVEKVVLIDGPAGDADLAAWSAKVKEGLGVRGTLVHEVAVNELTAVEGKRVIGETIAALGNDGFGAVITPGDPVAAGVIAGLQDANIDPTTISVTGLDATLQGAQAIVGGDQLLTTFAPETDAAQVAASIACGAALGAGFPDGLTTTPVDNGTGKVPTVFLTGIVVTSDGSVSGSRSIQDTLVADDAFGPDTAAQICTDDLAQACSDANIVVPSASPVASGSPAVASPAGSAASVASPAASTAAGSAAPSSPPATSPLASASAAPAASPAFSPAPAAS